MNFYHTAKQAGMLPELASSAGWGSIPVIGPLSGAGATVGALITPTRSEEEQDAADKAPEMNLLPGYGLYNFYKRVGRGRRKAKERSGSSGKWWSELAGRYANGPIMTALGTLVGTGIGTGIGMSNSSRTGDRVGTAVGGGLVGAGVGAGVGAAGFLLALLMAGMTKTRSKEEQTEVDKEGHSLKDYLIPGRAEYNLWKRLGHDAVNVEVESEDSK